MACAPYDLECAQMPKLKNVLQPLGLAAAICGKALTSMLRRFQRGQMIVVVAITATALVGAIALGADVAVMYFNWMELQKAADAAAVAGANYLPEEPDVAVSTANSYATSNGIQPSEIVSTLMTNNNTQITIKLQRTVPYYFASVLGMVNGPVAAGATASVPYGPTTVDSSGPGIYGSTAGQYGLLPIGVDYSTPYQYNQSVTLNYQKIGPGNWGSLALGASGGSNLRSNLANGYDGPISIGDWVTTEPGIKVGPVNQGFADRISAGLSAYPSGTFTSHALDDPRAVTVPMADWANINGSSQVLVKGFAELWIDSESGGTIQAHFIAQVVPNSVGGPSALFYGAQSPPIVTQ
jgi:hypothetical protein